MLVGLYPDAPVTGSDGSPGTCHELISTLFINTDKIFLLMDVVPSSPSEPSDKYLTTLRLKALSVI